MCIAEENNPKKSYANIIYRSRGATSLFQLNYHVRPPAENAKTISAKDLTKEYETQESLLGRFHHQLEASFSEEVCSYTSFINNAKKVYSGLEGFKFTRLDAFVQW